MAGLSASLALYALGHSATALAAGLLSQTLARGGSAAITGVTSEPRVILYFGLLGTSVKVTGAIMSAYLEAGLVGDIGRRLRRQIVTHVAQLGLSRPAPESLASYTTRAREVESAIVHGSMARLRAAAQLAPLALTLIVLSPSLAVGGALVAFTFGRGMALLRGRVRRTFEQTQQLAERTQCEVEELLRNTDLWRVCGATHRILKRIEDLSHRTTRATATAEAGRAGLSGANEFIAVVALLVVLVATEHTSVALQQPTIIAMIAVMFMAYRPLRDLGDSRVWCQRGEAALDALQGTFQGLASTPNGSEETAYVPESIPNWTLQPLRLVNFGAIHRSPLATAQIDPGSSLALVGPTGCGKTTLLRALLGLDPAVGALSYGVTDLAEAPLGPASRPFAWVPQDAPLITATLLENVALVTGDLVGAEAAIHQIGASALLARCGNATLGPNGRPLSGGERRLVAIARAITTRLPVILLDEPTEGLDAISAEAVLAALRNLKGSRTVITVTHRPEVSQAMARQLQLS